MLITIKTNEEENNDKNNNNNEKIFKKFQLVKKI